MVDDWLSTGASLLGAYLGSKGNDTTTTSTNAIDSRMGNYIYGNGSNVQGVLPAATDWYQKNQSGLNDQSLQGLNRQWNTASDPATAQGYTNMQSLGSSLMGGGVAGNPFTNGRASLSGGSNLGLGGPSAQPNFQNPATMGGATAGSTAGPFTQPTSMWHPQTQEAAISNWAQGPTGWTGGYDGGHNGSSSSNGANPAGASNSIGGLGSMGGVDGGFSPSYYGLSPSQAGYIGSLIGQLTGVPGLGLLGSLGGASLDNRDPTNPAGLNATNGMDSMSDHFGGGYGGFGGNGSSGGGDSGRGSQSSNGGRNGGDSGGF